MSKVAPNPNMYVVGGDVQASGGIYIPRKADDQLLALCRAGTFSYVLTPRQMGKSSLMKRTAERLAHDDIRTVIIDLTQIGTNITAEQWYLGLLSAIEDQLGLETDALGWWEENKHLGMTQRLTDFFRKVMMREVKKSVVIFIDEIDTTLKLDFTDDFFAAIRYLHNSRDQITEFKRLSFVLIGVATPSDLVRDPQRTPFNIGQRVDLTDFTVEEIQPLTAGLGLAPDETQDVLGWMLEWTNGHPYLTLRLCRTIALQGRESWTRDQVNRIVKRTFFNEQSEQDHNLQFVRDMLTARAPDQTAVIITYLSVLRGRAPVYDEEQSLIKSHLKLSGVVYREGGVLRLRNRIYRETFDAKWARDHLPQTLRRRLRWTAIVSGATTTLAVAGVFLIPLTLWALSSRAQALSSREQALSLREQALISATQETQARAEAEAARTEAVQATEEAQRQKLIAEEQGALAAERRREAEKQREIALAAVARETQARQQADALRREAQARQLGAFAEVTRNQQARFLKRSVLLAQESMQVPTEIGYQALNKGLALLPRPVARLEQPQPASGIAFAADSGSLVTFGENQPNPPGRKLMGFWTINRGTGGGPTFTENKQDIDFISPSLKYKLNGGHVIETKTGREIGKLNITFPHFPPIFSADPESRYVLFTSEDTALVFETATAQLAFDRPLKNGDKYLASAGRSQFGSYVASFNPTGEYLAITTFKGNEFTVHLLESANGKEFMQLHLPSQPTQILFSAAGEGIHLAIIGTDQRSVRVWDLTTEKEVARIRPKGTIKTAIFSPDGKYLATADGIDNSARVWQTSTGHELAHLRHEAALTDIAFSPDGQYLVTASLDATARVWDWQQESEITRMIHEGPVEAVAFDQTGRYVATASSSDKTVRVWEFAIGSNLIDLARGLRSDHSVNVSPAGDYIAVSGNDGIGLLDPKGGREIRRLDVSGPAWMLINSNGRYLATITEDEKKDESYIQWWDTKSGAPITKRQGLKEDSDERVIAISPDANYLIMFGKPNDSGSKDTIFKIVRKSDGREVPLVIKGELRGNEDDRIFIFSPDGRFFLAMFETSDDKSTLWAYETETGHGVPIQGASVNHLAVFSRDSKYLATNSDAGNTIRIWSTETWRLTATLSEHKEDIRQIAFSKDGDFLATTSDDNTAIVWSAAGGRWEAKTVKMLKKFTHEDDVTNVAFSHGLKYLATTGDDQTTRIWTLDSAREMARVSNSNKVVEIAFSPDDQVLVITTHKDSGFFDVFDFIASDAQLWLWSPEALLNETCARLVPNLTLQDWQEYEEWHKATIGDLPVRTCANLPTAPRK